MPPGLIATPPSAGVPAAIEADVNTGVGLIVGEVFPRATLRITAPQRAPRERRSAAGAGGRTSTGAEVGPVVGERRPGLPLPMHRITDRAARHSIVGSADCVIHGVERLVGRVEVEVYAGNWVIADSPNS